MNDEPKAQAGRVASPGFPPVLPRTFQSETTRKGRPTFGSSTRVAASSIDSTTWDLVLRCRKPGRQCACFPCVQRPSPSPGLTMTEPTKPSRPTRRRWKFTVKAPAAPEHKDRVLRASGVDPERPSRPHETISDVDRPSRREAEHYLPRPRFAESGRSRSAPRRTPNVSTSIYC